MFITVMFLILLSIIPYYVKGAIDQTCAPNSQFLANGRLCHCNSAGSWSQASCQSIGRQQTCQPGQIIWEECSECKCQENGKLLCTNTQCTDDSSRNNSDLSTSIQQWCTPYKSYYINCSLCVCPASGKMSEARCAIDSSCTFKGHLPSDVILKRVCVPKVMYVFSCLHCMCSDVGYFVKSKCVKTCHEVSESVKRCIPKTFYRVDCNVCRCPDNGILDSSVCTKSTCYRKSKTESLDFLKNRTSKCVSNKFTNPKCYYCVCNSQGVVNEHVCLELECLEINDHNYEFTKSSCRPGEMIPTCTECFCTPNGFTFRKYCTKDCSFNNRLQVLESILKQKVDLIDRNTLKRATGNEMCDANSVFLDNGRYCLCPDNGNASFKLCTLVTENVSTLKPEKVTRDLGSAIDFNAPCDPNTYIEFGCNSCYCTKQGKIDPKWCTRDDCEAKRVIQETQKTRLSLVNTKLPGSCVPGSIYQVDCNFCICGESGKSTDKACTKNTCSGEHKSTYNEFVCEPSVYYMVDCNICYCPIDGIKNLDKCTKNQCDSNFLRTDSCIPGKLFSDECNICVCPQNGDKKDKVCTNRTCAEADTPWKKIFRLSQSLLGNGVDEDTTSNLDRCFPGEEYEVGCKVCVCPEMGLREYAACSSVSCDEGQNTSSIIPIHQPPPQTSKRIEIQRDREADGGKGHQPRVQRRDEICKSYNLSDNSEKRCTPGSMYIIRCQQCICPYIGNIDHFCRPLPYGTYCEQAYPNFNFIPMGRRSGNASNSTLPDAPRTHLQVTVPHNHTFFRCEQPGRVEDGCHICQCEDTKVIVEEHCFKSNAEGCMNAMPSFLDENYVKQHPLNSCNLGDTVQNECNKCVCTLKAIFECTSLNCDTTKSILKQGGDAVTCHPNQLYAQNLISCICTKDGRWPHNSCQDTFHSLPPKNLIKHKCEPNTYVVIDCNICRCGPHGEILNNQCTKNVCDGDIMRRSNKLKQVYGNCEIQNWYSLAPCQFCLCVNENKLVCNTGNHYSKNLELGIYNLVVCGKELIRDAKELMPDKEITLRLGLDNDRPKLMTNEKSLNVKSVHHIDNANKQHKDVYNSKGDKFGMNYYFTGSEEDNVVQTVQSVSTAGTAKIIQNPRSTQNPYHEGDETNNDTDYEGDKKESFEYDSSDEEAVEELIVPTMKSVKAHKGHSFDEADALKTATSTAFGETLQINLPQVLDKVFQMDLRKSMVTLNSTSNCTPGTTNTKDCNMCFCMKNTKLLCTNKPCK